MGQLWGSQSPHALETVRLCCPYVNEENKLVYIKTPHIKYLMMKNVLRIAQSIKVDSSLHLRTQCLFISKTSIVWEQKYNRELLKTKEKIGSLVHRNIEHNTILQTQQHVDSNYRHFCFWWSSTITPIYNFTNLCACSTSNLCEVV